MSQPTKVKLRLPADACEFRDRIRIYWAAIEFLKIKHPLNAAIQTSNKEVWENHVDHMMGDKVKNKEVVAQGGKSRKSPDWNWF